MIDVVAGVISLDGKILIARRNDDKHMGGLWEFPGGKIEVGETPQQCIVRELLEEFNINVEAGGFIAESIFDYGEKIVRLMGYDVKYLNGDFVLSDHSEIAWIAKDQFSQFEFAPADLPIIEKLLSNN
jgi:mutator protein MutT